ncbi:MAG: hypothetical protein U0326_39770 [Polyangiales bacterium]
MSYVLPRELASSVALSLAVKLYQTLPALGAHCVGSSALVVASPALARVSVYGVA